MSSQSLLPKPEPAGLCFSRLRDLVESGQLILSIINSLPRAVSTALERSLAESPNIDGQLHEPFTFRRNDFESGCGEILHRATRLFNSITKHPIHLLLKTMTYNTSREHFSKLLHLAHNAVTLVRNPQSQLYSLLLAYHEMNSDVSGDRAMSARLLACQQRFAAGDSATTVGRPGWQSLHEDLLAVDTAKATGGLAHVTVDGMGFMFADRAEKLLRHICCVWNIDFCPEMAGEHSDGTEATNHWALTAESKFESGWPAANQDPFSKRATSSKGWRFGQPTIPSLYMLPRESQQYLWKTAFPVYIECLERPDQSGPAACELVDFYGDSCSELAANLLDSRLSEHAPLLPYSYFVRSQDETS